AIELAKRQRKEKKRALQKRKVGPTIPALSLPVPATEAEEIRMPNQSTHESAITLDSVIYFLNQLKKDYYASNQSKMVLEQMEKENERLRAQVLQLEKQLAHTEKQLATIQEDYQVFIQIMDRARKMTVLDDQGTLQSPAFR